jgi:hypothetical protein
MKALLLLCSIGLLGAGPPVEQTLSNDAFTATLTVSPLPVEVGAPLEVVVSLEGQDMRNAVLPTIAETFGPFEVRSATPLAAPAVGLRLELVTFEAGDVELPILSVGDLSFDPVAVSVTTLMGEDTGPDAFHDIRGAVAVQPLLHSSGWWLVGGVLGIIVAASLLVWLFTRTKTPEPAEAADAWAQRNLDALEHKGLPAAGKVQPFFIELTDIGRAFIERRFDLDAPDRTTPEFIREAARHPELDPTHATLLGRLLTSADKVKFAGDRPATTECDRALSLVRTFVRESGPKPPPRPEEGAAE